MKKVYPSPEERALQIPLHEYGIIPCESLPYLRRRIAEEIQAAIKDTEERLMQDFEAARQGASGDEHGSH